MRINIALEDMPDGNVMVQTISEPSIEEWDDEDLTDAQMIALEWLDSLQDALVEGEVQ